MNIATIAICYLAYRMLGNNSTNRSGTASSGSASSGILDNMLSEEAKSIMGSIDTLTHSQGDKTGALLSILTNPSVMAVVSSMFGGVLDSLINFGKNTTSSSADTAEFTGSNPQQSESNHTVSYTTDNTTDTHSTAQDSTPYYGGTDGAHEFFAPVDNIAGREVSSKLYYIYDNWYNHT